MTTLQPPDRITLRYKAALNDFRRARRRAVVHDLLARVTGNSDDLIDYDNLDASVSKTENQERHQEEIPLDAIVGSVGRYSDFTRDFLPRKESDEDRWAQVKVAMLELGGVPPIDLYRVGKVYFVLDGNHRVSVAREIGWKTIAAYVSEVHSEVEISQSVKPDEAIIKARRAAFMKRFGLDDIRPGHDLHVTVAGQYRVIEEHIEQQRQSGGDAENCDESDICTATAEWYDTIYLPVVDLIRERGVLKDFPGRTETDLYVWLMQHRDALQNALGWDIQVKEAAADISLLQSRQAGPVLARLSRRIKRQIRNRFESSPTPGAWLRTGNTETTEDRLFCEILVPLPGTPDSWNALTQAKALAQLDGAHIRAVHVVAGEKDKQNPFAVQIKAKFEQWCAENGVSGEIAIGTGPVGTVICDRVRWTDLVVLHMEHPPDSGPLARLGNGLISLIRSSSRPILIVPWVATELAHPLLAYDGSPKADEALYIAAYMAGCWQRPLTILIVSDDEKQAAKATARAKNYLKSQNVEAQFEIRQGDVAEAIMGTSLDRHCDLVVMGGYGQRPILEVVLGSSVDRVLRESWVPVLICR